MTIDVVVFCYFAQIGQVLKEMGLAGAIIFGD
jgi:hypothetical protein